MKLKGRCNFGSLRRLLVAAGEGGAQAGSVHAADSMVRSKRGGSSPLVLQAAVDSQRAALEAPRWDASQVPPCTVQVLVPHFVNQHLLRRCWQTGGLLLRQGYITPHEVHTHDFTAMQKIVAFAVLFDLQELWSWCGPSQPLQLGILPWLDERTRRQLRHVHETVTVESLRDRKPVVDVLCARVSTWLLRGEGEAEEGAVGSLMRELLQALRACAVVPREPLSATLASLWQGLQVDAGALAANAGDSIFGRTEADSAAD